MKPLCIAHRGCHWKCYENTKEAFLAAKAGSFFGVETDIHLTKDKKWIIHHDPDFLSNNEKHIIKKERFDELRKLPLDNENHYEAYLPSLEEYLEILKDSGKRPIIEIKPKNPSFHQLKKMVRIVRKYFELSQVDFIAFYPWPLLKLRCMYHKKVHLQQLVEHTHPSMVSYCYKMRLNIDIEGEMLTKEIVDKFHKKNLTANVWTVDKKEDLEKFTSFEVDFITTNTFDQNS